MNDTNNTIFVLDAGGTGFKFNAMRDFRQIIDAFTIPSAADSLDAVLHKIIQGFRMTEERCGCRPRAISFSFPALPITATALSATWATCPLSAAVWH